MNNIFPEKTGVGILIISKKTNRILLNLRAQHKTHSMCWSLFGGMIEDGEQPKEALFRELTEEMGFVPDLEKITHLMYIKVKINISNTIHLSVLSRMNLFQN